MDWTWPLFATKSRGRSWSTREQLSSRTFYCKRGASCPGYTSHCSEEFPCGCKLVAHLLLYLSRIECLKTSWGVLITIISRGHTLKKKPMYSKLQFSSVQSLSPVWLLATPWIAACQASLSITNSQRLLKLMLRLCQTLHHRNLNSTHF